MARKKTTKKKDDKVKEEKVETTEEMLEEEVKKEDQETISMVEEKEEPKATVTVEVKPKEESKGKVFFNNPVLDEYFNRYLDAINKKDVKTSIKTLVNIVNILTRKFDKKNYDALYKFFSEYKDSILDEKVALQGIETLTMNMRAKVEIIYSVMRVLTKFPNRKKSVNINIIRQVLKDEDAVNWFNNKLKK